MLRLPGSRQLSPNGPIIGLLLLTMGLATALRLYHLGAQGLWVDEIFTALFARADNDLGDVAQRALSTPIPTPPLWFFITHFFVKALGSSNAVVRLPSVIAGVLGIVAIYKVGQALFDRPTGLISAVLLAVSPAHVHFSQEARFYAGVVLFSLLSLYFLYRGVNSDDRKWWIGFTVATLMNLYVHLTAFLVLAVELLYACLLLLHDRVAARRAGAARRPRATFALPLLISFGVIAAGYLPMMPYLLIGVQGPRGLGNPGDIAGLHLSVSFFLSLFASFGAGPGIPLSLYMGACLWGLIHGVRKQGRQVLLVLLWTLLPFAIVLVLRPKHWFAPKYVIFILPVYLIAVSRGITYLARSVALSLRDHQQRPLRVPTRVDRRVQRRMIDQFLDSLRSYGDALRLSRFLPALTLAVLVAGYGGMSILVLDEVYARRRGRWQEIGQFLATNIQPGDAVALVPLSLLTMPAQDLMAYYGPTSKETNVVVVRTGSQMKDLLASHRRIWILINRRSQLDESRELAGWLARQPHVELSLGNGAKVLYTGKDQTRLALLEEASSFTILRAETHGSIARAYRSLGMGEEALAAYRRAAAMEPERGIWHYHLAGLYEELGRYDQAVAEYEQAIRLQPEISGFHAALGDFYRRAGLADEAIAQYREAIRLYVSQNRGAERSAYVRSWSHQIRELERLTQRAEVANEQP